MAIYDINGNVINLYALDYDRTVKGIAHRGFSTEAPENTLPAYKLARERGFIYVECDVSFTSDGVAMLLHDSTIDRTSNGTGTLSEMTYTQVRQYDFGSWKSSEYAGTVIPTFEEFIVLCKNLGLHPYIELKRGGALTEARVQGLVDIVKACGMSGKVTWGSFSATYLTHVKNYDSKANIGYIVNEVTSTVITNAQGLKTTDNTVFINTKWTLLTSAMIELVKAADIPLEVWVIDTEAEIETMDSYISGVTSNNLIAGKVLYSANI